MSKSREDRFGRRVRQAVVVAAPALLVACASYPSNIELGMSHEDLVRRFGAPAVERASAAGEHLVYPTGPFGQYAYAVDLDERGRVAAVGQVLTLENFGKIRVGEWTREDVLVHFGPPAGRRRLQDHQAWDYRYREWGVYNSLFTVSFDEAGLVAKTENGPDWMFDGGKGRGRR